MISGYFRARGGIILQPLAGLMLAAGFVLLLAGRYEAQLVRFERSAQEISGR